MPVGAVENYFVCLVSLPCLVFLVSFFILGLLGCIIVLCALFWELCLFFVYRFLL